MKNKKAYKKRIKELIQENKTIRKINKVLINQIDKAGTDSSSVIVDGE